MVREYSGKKRPDTNELHKAPHACLVWVKHSRVLGLLDRTVCLSLARKLDLAEALMSATSETGGLSDNRYQFSVARARAAHHRDADSP
jgi:hypothetical protein